jgi:hypothetical protein
MRRSLPVFEISHPLTLLPCVQVVRRSHKRTPPERARTPYSHHQIIYLQQDTTSTEYSIWLHDYSDDDRGLHIDGFHGHYDERIASNKCRRY